MRLCVKDKRVAVDGVRLNYHEHGDQAEPQATADTARCTSEPRPYLRLQRTDQHLRSAGKTKAVVLGGLADSASRRSFKKQAPWHDHAGALAGTTTNTLEPVVIATCSA